MTKNFKKKKYKEKYWSRLDSSHCALGCWIKRKPLRPLGHHVLYTTLEQFTYIPFTNAHQVKLARPWHRILIKEIYLSKALTCINKNCFFVKETDTFGHIVV